MAGYGAGSITAPRSTSTTTLTVTPAPSTITRVETTTQHVTLTTTITRRTVGVVDVEPVYDVITNTTEINVYLEQAALSQHTFNKTAILEGLKNPAIALLRVRMTNRGPGTICVVGTGCNMDVFILVKKIKILEGNLTTLPLKGICLPLWYMPLKPGHAIEDKTFSKYHVLLVDRPLKALMTVEIEICATCTPQHLCLENITLTKTINIHIP